MSKVQQITITPEDADQRLDRFLRRQFAQLNQIQIEKLCRKGEFRVDGGRVKPNTRLAAGQVLRIPPLPDAPAAPYVPKPRPNVTEAQAQMIQSCVLWRDDDIIALNKPPGLPTQGGSGQKLHVDGLAEALCFGYDEKPRLVHRLDKDTSGVLLLARKRSIAAKLADAFRHRNTRKIYWAAVAGVPTPAMGTIKYGLVKAPGHGGRGEGEKMICIPPARVHETEGAKRAITDYAVLSALARRLSWLAMVPVTGRTHQLRAHIAELGHPIIGDGKYGGSGQENLGDGWGAGLGGEISRKLHLHARYLSLEHPTTGRALNFTAPLPDHMQRTWDHFDWRPGDVPVDPFDPDAIL